MKRQIRRGVFETNSSSTHSLTMCTQEQFDDWKNGKLLYNYWKEEFVKAYELTDSDKENAKEDYEDNKSPFWKDWDQLTDVEKNNWYDRYIRKHKRESDYDCKTYEEWKYDDNLEYFVDTYTTPGGEKVVAFGKYGYDG